MTTDYLGWCTTVLVACCTSFNPLLSSPQALAHGIYDEFQEMVQLYGPESIGSLMPLVVNVLENLDSALADNQVRVHVCVLGVWCGR